MTILNQVECVPVAKVTICTEKQNMGLEQNIEQIRKEIEMGQFTSDSSEAAVSQGIVLRLLHALNWPTFNTKIVWPEFGVEGTRVDYALCNSAEKPIAFIEVKKMGQSQGAEKQLFQYAFHKGIQLAILTDGREWNFYLPAEHGDYSERSVYKLDIVKRNLGECALRLNRYLDYQAVISGKAVESARADYRDVTRDREIQSTLPKAWNQLVRNKDEILVDLVAEQVENLCGYKPEDDVVMSFIKSELKISTTPSEVIPPKPVIPIDNEGWVKFEDYNPSPGTKPPVAIRFWDGKVRQVNHWYELLLFTVRELYTQNRINDIDIPIHSSKKRYIVNRTPEHPDGEKFIDFKQVDSFPLYINKNLNAGQIRSNVIKLLEKFAPKFNNVFVKID